MDQALQEILFEKYPELYEQRTWDMKATCMCWGFEVPDVWFDIIDDLSAKIVAISPETRAVQVKEKFNELRFYVENTKPENREAVFALIDEAVMASNRRKA